MKFGLTEEVVNEIIRVLKQNNVLNAYLFGSRARGDFTEVSDIDIAVCLSGDSTVSKLKYQLEEIRCIYKFDVVDLDKLKDDKLRTAINNQGISLIP